MRKGFNEDVPDANPDYQPAYDTQEQPWPWRMNQRIVFRGNNIIFDRKVNNNCDSENEDAEQATVPTETETSAEAKEDGKDEEKNKSTLISNCGNIDVGLEYALTNKRITVTILECTDLPNQDRGVPPIIQVCLSSTG